MEHKSETGLPDSAMADELFGLVEEHQGYAYISDGIGVLSRREILNLARGSLRHSRQVVKRLYRFIQKYENELQKAD